MQWDTRVIHVKDAQDRVGGHSCYERVCGQCCICYKKKSNGAIANGKIDSDNISNGGEHSVFNECLVMKSETVIGN